MTFKNVEKRVGLTMKDLDGVVAVTRCYEAPISGYVHRDGRRHILRQGTIVNGELVGLV
jgi:hypothetical protein